MIFEKRILASVAAVWLLAVLAIAAIAVTATAASGGAVLDDVQVGERGNMTRIALLCSAECNLETDDAGEFLLRGIASAVDIDLTKRSKFVRSFATKPSSEGSRIKIVAAENVSRVENKQCKVAGRAATCIDLFFNQPADALASAAPAKPPSAKPPPPQAGKNKIKQKNVAASPKLDLREAAEERFKAYAKLEAPERLAPPTGAILANVTPIEPSVDVRRPAVTPGADALGASAPRNFDFAQDAAQIVGKILGPAECANAEATLQADAWALGAMVDLGYCYAITGDAEKADAIFARLLEYTPDNYEALVGRALIAAVSGEKSIARKYFQDALNALPPVDESNRIVDAMASL